MKKVLSFVLVLAMILGSVSMAFATCPDVVGTEYESAVTLLVDLGVISGYASGDFKPENSVTRAEFAKIVVKSLGLNYDGATATTSFSDVASTDWYSGYVQAASELGIVNGYSDGTFKPTKTVSYNEAVAMVVRALGFEDDHLVGKYPTAHISKAKGLGMLQDLPVGSAAATRGNIAKLLYNTLEVNFVTYQGDNGYQTSGDTMLKRLSAKTGTSTDDPMIITGSNVADDVNIKSYLGAYATVYYNSDNEISAIKSVKSSFLTGKFNAAGTTFTVDDVEYTVNATTYVPVDSTVATNPAAFINGEVTDAAAVSTYGTNEVTIAANVSGKTVKAVYSVLTWVEGDTWQYDDGDFDEEDCEIGAHSFAKNDDKELDYTAFELLGVSALTDIKEDNIVTVYENRAGKVVKVEVGTATVEGKIAEKTSAGKFLIGSTYYKNSAREDATSFKVGDEGTFYLDYSGKLYALEGAATSNLYGVIEDIADGASGLSAKDAKVLMVTTDGSKVTYVGSPKFVGDSKQWATSYGSLPATNVAVIYTLNSSDQIYTLTTAGLNLSAGSGKILKTGVVSTSGLDSTLYVTADTKVLLKSTDNKYTAVDGTSLFGTSYTNLVGYYKDGYVKFVVVSGSTASKSDYVLFNGWTEVENDDYNYRISVFNEGVAENYNTNMAPAQFVATTAATELYKLDVSNGLVASVTPLAGTAATVNSTTKTSVSGNIFKDATGATYTLASDVVVYLWNADDGVWEVSTTAKMALKTTSATAQIKLFMTDAEVGTYDVVLVVK